jgi:glycosyltransferase involved in cell wall biosynthesis
MALADAMERLLLNNNLRQSMGRAGRLLAERWFSIESIVAQHLQVYERLLSKASIQKTGA